MRILFLGDDWIGSNATSLADGFRRGGHDVVVVDTTSVSLPAQLSPPWVYSKVVGRRAPWNVERATADRAPRHRLPSGPDLRVQDRSPRPAAAARNTGPAARPLQPRRRVEPVQPRPATSSSSANGTSSCRPSGTMWRNSSLGAREVKFVLSAYDPAWHHPRARRDATRYWSAHRGMPGRSPRQIVALGHAYGDRCSCVVRDGGAYRSSGGPEGWPARSTARLSRASSPRSRRTSCCSTPTTATHTPAGHRGTGRRRALVGEQTEEHAELLDEGTECLLFSDADELYELLRRCEDHPDWPRRSPKRGKDGSPEAGTATWIVHERSSPHCSRKMGSRIRRRGGNMIGAPGHLGADAAPLITTLWPRRAGGVAAVFFITQVVFWSLSYLARPLVLLWAQPRGDSRTPWPTPVWPASATTAE